MKNKTLNLFIIPTVLLALLAIMNGVPLSAYAQGTAFTYQGRLNENGTGANGLYDFRFRLASDPLGNNYVGTFATNGIAVSNGLFTTTIDFGTGVFTGSNYWLEVDARTNGTGSYTDLNPLQGILPAPYAVFAATASNLSGTIPSAGLSGAYGNAVTFNNPNNSFNGNYSGNGANVTNVNAAALNGLGAASFWQLGGNGVGSGQFIGSTNNQPVEIWVNGSRSLRLEPGAAGIAAPNIIGGSPVNFVASGVTGATIGGGGGTNYEGGYYLTNSVTADFGTVSGGGGNTVGGGALGPVSFSTIGGGEFNTDEGGNNVLGGGLANTINNSQFATIGGGAFNNALGQGAFIGGGGSDGNTFAGNDAVGNASVIGGGMANTNYGNYSTIAGGQNNLDQLSSSNAVISGGSYNTIQATAPWAVIGGGGYNTIKSGTGNSIGGGLANVVGGTVSAIGGGGDNIISGIYDTIGGGAYNTNLDTDSVIAGGIKNYIAGGGINFIGGGTLNAISGLNADGSVIVGGTSNVVTGGYGVVPGGLQNLASGNYSFAAGYHAQAINNGAFVWADSEGSAFSSTSTNQFNVRANGGVRFVTGGAGMTVDGQSVLENNGTLSNATLTGTVSLPTNVYSGGVLFLHSDNNYNFYAGQTAGNLTTSGQQNTGVGFSALNADASGSFNTALGESSLPANTSGSFNTALGNAALFDNQSGSNDTAVGYESMGGSSGNGNTAVGAGAMAATSGNDNIAVGYLAATATSFGSSNIYIGNSGNNENNTIRIGSLQTAAYIAGVVKCVGGVQIGSGIVFTNVETGQAIMPSSSTQETNYTIVFPTAFSSTPKIIFSLANDTNFQSVSDVFAANVSSNSPTAFSVNVYRLNGTFWSQQLRVNWQAWQ